MSEFLPLLIGGALVLGGAAGYFIRHIFFARKSSSIEHKIISKLGEAEERSKKIILEAESKAVDLLGDVRREGREQKTKLDSLEERILHREEILDKKLVALSNDENSLKAQKEEIKKKELEIDNVKNDLESQLEKTSGLTRDEALKLLTGEIKEKYILK